MYIMRKMNREKKAATDSERAALLADGYRDVILPASHEDMSAEKEDPVVMREPVKKEKLPAGKNPDKAQDPIKKAKTADTKQKKSVEAGRAADQEPVEAEGSTEPESADPMQKETVKTEPAPGAQQPVGETGPAQEQPTETTDSVQPFPKASQNPQ